jgi:hypothetical protein
MLCSAGMIQPNTRGIGWRTWSRCLVFVLASTSLGCLMAQFYGLCSMRLFAGAVFLPASLALLGLAGYDLFKGDGRLGWCVLTGLGAGLLAAVAYDVFRLPFVFSRQWGLSALVPALDLFKVFPGFGAMLLGQPVEQPRYSTTTSLLGWAYHFSNGATIGLMYVALIGDPRRRHWAWAILLATALELGMILTPYPRVFGITVTPRFVFVTMAAHAIFGVCLGWAVKWFAGARPPVKMNRG